MADGEYKLEAVKATKVAADDIDKTFRSSSIGMFTPRRNKLIILPVFRPGLGDTGGQDPGLLR
jgi:hypothetical protein